ncbi:replication initiation protein [Phycicoccus sp. MAQZ13P-2]|uniref:replication initiator n=1 Tax=Phycicoccus mangrovi TaxID=2840470 RepID=UPI001C002E15|nr:replication initiator [Phycicoccus mangrovi]MBT9275973.1 replication initiation protein [Phycicoccus mangrovi]
MRPCEIPLDAVQEYAVKERVCIRPLLRRVIDRETGEVTVVALPCQSTRESRCPSCAARARTLRMTQCLAGWHLEEEPDWQRPPAAPNGDPAPEPQAASNRSRSTRRRGDVPDLPRVHQEDRTVGRVFESPDGRTYRPSMFITLTLPGYGRIVPGTGTPRDWRGYDYRRAALDAMHFPRLLDRWFQNLRRCAGYKVQYFGAVEGQRRLAPHFHVAVRGAIPRTVIKEVTKATYLQLWWPPMNTPIHVAQPPVWDGLDYLDPVTGEPLRTWAAALDALDADPSAQPAHVLRFGPELDVQGLLAGSPDADRSVRYLTKYLTKAVGETYAVDSDAAYEAHIDRLHDQVRWLPCSPDCANWLRFGIQPRIVGPGLQPGRCPGKAHDREHLGVGGRRVLVSRGWSGKTLADHKADRATVVKQALEAAGIEVESAQRMAADVTASDGDARFLWSAVVSHGGTSAAVLMDTVNQRRRWRAQYEHAKSLSGTDPPVDGRSATGDEKRYRTVG